MTVIGWYHVFFCVFFRFFGGVHSSNTLKFCQCFDGKKCVFQTLIRARLSGPLKIFSQLPNQQMHSHMLKAEALHTWCGWISSMSCSATSLATTEPCRKKRPHQWISISMPCVPLLPMLVIGTCPHPDSFCALKKKWKQEPSKHPVHFYQNVWQSETNLQLEIQETQSLQWAKTRNRAFNLRAKSKKKQKTHQYNSSFSSKDLLHFAKRNHPMSPKSHWFPSPTCLNARTDNLPSASITWQRNHSQSLRAPEWMISSSRSLGLFFLQVNFLFGRYATWVAQSPIMSRDDFFVAECCCACCVSGIITGFAYWYWDLVG